MWQAIEYAVLTDLVKPGMLRNSSGTEKVVSMFVEDVVWESANHPEEIELLEMKKSCSRKTSRKKKGDRSWCSRMESLEIFLLYDATSS